MTARSYIDLCREIDDIHVGARDLLSGVRSARVANPSEGGAR